MFHKLKSRLILLYTFSTGIILTIVVIVALWSSERQLEEKSKESFQELLYSFTDNLLYNNRISHEELATEERKNKVLIFIEDNNKPITFRKLEYEKKEIEKLKDKIIKLAEKDGISIDVKPVFSIKQTSKVYQLKEGNREGYFGGVSVVGVEKGFRSLVLLQWHSLDQKDIIKQRILFLCFGIMGIGALFVVSYWFVNREMKPVEDNQRRQTEFIGAASHELRSPLSVIRTNASAIVDAPEEAARISRNIERECIRMAGLIEDMLLLASAGGKNWTIKKESMDVDTLLMDVLELFERNCLEKGFSFNLILPEESLPKINNDKNRLQQVIGILLDNALSHSHGIDKRLFLRVYKKKNHVIIEVEDHGIGISEEKRSLIFNPFYQEDKARTDKSHFGLGLSIASELVKLMDGTIAVKETNGGGCTFCIAIPF